MPLLPDYSLGYPTAASSAAANSEALIRSNGPPPSAGNLLATALADRSQHRLALGALILSALVFALAVPFARVPLAPLSAFIPAYEAALLVVDAITAVMLFGQFAQQRSAALLALAAGYLFDGLMTVAHALSFPGLLAPSGWLAGGTQTTAWLYMFWHGGFPLFVIAYAVLARSSGRHRTPSAKRSAAIFAGAAVFGACALLIAVATIGHDLLPAIMAGSGYTPSMKLAVGVVWLCSMAAAAALIANRPHSLLDLWLLVVMFAWTFDVALSAVLNAGRFDLGFYAGRCYGLLAASFVLAMLLIQSNQLQGRLATAMAQLSAYARDLNARVQDRTAELLRANRQLGAILEASPVAIFMLDEDGRVALWTLSAERMFGYSQTEAVGRVPPYVGEEDAGDFQAHFDRVMADPAGSGFFETLRRRKDGSPIEVSVRWARVKDDAGRLLGIMYAIADISERKRLERQLVQAQKMEAIGHLTGGLAHDFNNLLAVVVLNLDMLRERLDADAEADELTREAMAAALRGAELVHRLLAFARRQPLQPRRTDVNALVTEATKLLERTLGEEIGISLRLDDLLWPVVVDPVQLEAALTNLATNARDAMPGGGELTIGTANRHLDEDYAAQCGDLAPGPYAMIEVSDTGSGIPPEALQRVFEPFFTTKPPGKGTGLGLSMVYGFAKQSGGQVNIYSEVGVGTTVRIYLPRAREGAEFDGPEPPRAFVRGHGETVLAVEDNTGLRRVVVRQLTELGYRVVEAEDAAAALRLLDSEAVALLFTDVVLPGGISGYELARTALSRWPTVKVVLTSGFPDTRIGGEGRPANLRLLGKPYRREDLAQIIRAALDEAPPS